MKLGILGSGTASREPPALWAQWAQARPDRELVLINPRFVTFAFSAYERLLVDVGYVDAAQYAEASGCTAIVINSFADYGIDAARAALHIPVIGAGETALRRASAEGTRPFSIVTVWPQSMRFLYEERLRATNLGHLCRGIHHLSDESELGLLAEEDGVMSKMARHDSQIVTRLIRICETAMANEGAQAIALGCTCMAPIGAELARRLPMPVIESSHAAIDEALSLTTHDPAAGTEQATVQRSGVPALVDAWFQVNPAAISTVGDCPVCIGEVGDQ